MVKLGTPLLLPQTFPLPQSNSLTDVYWLINGFALRDPALHDNTTTTGSVPDQGTQASPGPFFLFPVEDEIPPVRAYAVWIYNGTNQSITAQVLGNVVPDQSYPNFTVGNISPSIVTLSPWWFTQSFVDVPLEYIAAQVRAAVAPTTGLVYGVLFLYH